MESFLIEPPHPSRNSILVSYFHLKNWAFETHLPLEIAINLPWVGMDIFWHYTIWELCSAALVSVGLTVLGQQNGLQSCGLENSVPYYNIYDDSF